MNTVTGRVTHLHRLTTSVNGNPRFIVWLDNGRYYQTSSNASIAYEINNSEFWRRAHTFALTRAGRISHEVKP